MRNFIAIFWSLAGAWPAQAQFTLTTNNGAITIAQYTGAGGMVTIPSSTNGYPVTTIGTNAFYGLTNLSGVTIPDSVTDIEVEAFAECPGLADVTIPDRVTTVGAGAFVDCIGLTNVTIGSSVVTIGDEAFDYTGLRNVTIPDSVTTIGVDVFDASGLTNVTIGASVTSISAGAFRYCPLTSVTIPNSVTNICGYAFYQCESLARVTIGSGVSSVGDSAFEYCGSLTNLVVDAANPNYASAGGVLFDQSMTALIQFPKGLTGGYVIPSRVTSIGEMAFKECLGLTNVTIPRSVTSIGAGAFAYSGLVAAYFQGNAPLVDGGPGSADTSVFYGDSFHGGPGTAYYLSGTTGWGATFGGWPTAPWYQSKPQILGSTVGLGALTHQFGFTVSWATNSYLVIETCTNPAGPVWTPLATNVPVNGTVTFSDPQWSDYPSRYYRLKTP